MPPASIRFHSRQRHEGTTSRKIVPSVNNVDACASTGHVESQRLASVTTSNRVSSKCQSLLSFPPINAQNPQIQFEENRGNREASSGNSLHTSFGHRFLSQLQSFVPLRFAKPTNVNVQSDFGNSPSSRNPNYVGIAPNTAARRKCREEIVHVINQATEGEHHFIKKPLSFVFLTEIVNSDC